MDRLIELLNILNNGNVSLENSLEFIELVYPKLFPNKSYNPKYAIQIIQLGYGQQLISGIYSKVISEPKKFGIEIVQLLNKDNVIIKTIITKCKND